MHHFELLCSCVTAVQIEGFSVPPRTSSSTAEADDEAIGEADDEAVGPQPPKVPRISQWQHSAGCPSNWQLNQWKSFLPPTVPACGRFFNVFLVIFIHWLLRFFEFLDAFSQCRAFTSVINITVRVDVNSCGHDIITRVTDSHYAFTVTTAQPEVDLIYISVMCLIFCDVFSGTK